MNVKKYYEKFNNFSGDLDEKVKSRMGFLKEKILRNVDEVKKLAKILLTQRLTSNLLPSNKTKYFNILKMKKIRDETHCGSDVNQCQNLTESIDPVKKDQFNNYENFFNYEHSSESEKDSQNGNFTIKTENNEDEIFKQVFNPKFVSINQFKEDEEEDFVDLSNLNCTNNYNVHINHNTQPFPEKSPSTNMNNSTITNNCHNNDLKNSIFTDEEVKEFSNIFNELKDLNNTCCYDEGKINQMKNIDLLLKKKKYNILTSDDKKNLVEMAKKSNAKVVSKKYGIPLKSLKRWLLLGHERKKGGGRKEKDPEMEAHLYSWYKEFHVQNKHYVTSKIVKQKALELTKFNDFVASKDWLNKFKKKFSIEIIKEADLNKLLK